MPTKGSRNRRVWGELAPTPDQVAFEAQVQGPIEMRSTSQRFAEGEIYTAAAGCGMITLFQGIDAVVRQSRGSAPDNDVTMVQDEAQGAVAARNGA
jgi:hypothetical protein